MASIYILRHEDLQFTSSLRIFSNVDSALDFMKELVVHDRCLAHYELSKYTLEDVSQQYMFDHAYDLSELIQIEESVASDDYSVLDSDVDDVDSP